jgi:hypothetical protein
MKERTGPERSPHYEEIAGIAAAAKAWGEIVRLNQVKDTLLTALEEIASYPFDGPQREIARRALERDRSHPALDLLEYASGPASDSTERRCWRLTSPEVNTNTAPANLELVDEYGEKEWAIVKASPMDGSAPYHLVCGYRLDDDDVQRPDVRYPEDSWPTQDEAWAFVCGYSRGSWDNR